MSWLLGQIVGVLHETGAFTIKKIEQNHLVLEDEHGFDYTFPKSVVVVRQPIETPSLKPKELTSTRKPSQLQQQGPKNQQLPTIDLHAENLNLPIGLSTHAIFLAQLSAFKNYCNLQAQQRRSKFIVIHGAGEGKLKAEISVLCKGKQGIAMHDAQWSNGAVGASFIELQLSRFEYF